MNDSGADPSTDVRATREHDSTDAAAPLAASKSERIRRAGRLGVKLHGADSLTAILDRSVAALHDVTGASRAFIALDDRESSTLRGARGWGIANEVVAAIVVPLKRTATDDGVLTAVFRLEQPALVDGVEPGHREFDGTGFGPCARALTVPLVGPSGAIGTMTALWDEPVPSDDSVVDLSMILADHVASAIVAQGRVEAERRERVIADELHAVAQRITNGLSLDDVLASVLRAVEKLLDATSSSIFLAGPSGAIANRRFTTRNTGLPHWDDHVSTRPNGTTATVLRTGQPAVIEDAALDPRVRGVGKGDSRTFVAIPLRYDAQTVGVLYANWREHRRLVSRELHLLEVLAAYGAVAVQNARLHEEEIEAARYDGVLLAARTVAHEINNDLALTMGMAEIAQMQAHAGQLPDPSILDDVILGAQRIAKHVRQLQGVVRVEERHLHDLPPLLELGSSGE